MHFGRKDLAGAACAVLAIGLIAWLSLDSWARADCRDLLRTADFAAAPGEVSDPELAALKARLETGQASEAEQVCAGRIGLPFED